jgi:hypothetical protein
VHKTLDIDSYIDESAVQVNPDDFAGNFGPYLEFIKACYWSLGIFITHHFTF